MSTAKRADPLALCSAWLAEAATSEPDVPTAMALATADAAGAPSVRMVLLKEIDDRGFVFYTNLESRKGCELEANPRASLCLHWKSLGRQVRIDGAVERVEDAEADAYFASRPRDAQIGAWASAQSRPIEGRFGLAIGKSGRQVRREVRHWNGRAPPALVGLPRHSRTRRVLAPQALAASRARPIRAFGRRLDPATALPLARWR